MIKDIKHIFFDLDNTLWDFEKNSREALLHLFLEYDIETKCSVDFLDFIHTYETINHDLWHLYSLQLTTKEELRYQRFYKAFTKFGYENLDLAHRWADEYLKISPYKTHLIEGTIETLDYLRNDYSIHLITNGFKEVQDIKLNHCNLKPYFNQIIISEEHGFNKPDIKIFQLAEKLTNSNHQECVMIGDNYDTDILGALNANWKAIHLIPDSDANENVNGIKISHLKQLKDLF